MSRTDRKKKEGLTQQAYKAIKTMILENELKPGQFINEAQIQEQLGIGRTPVREAILQLSRDQLITIHPRKGIEITKISPKAIHDIFVIRSIIEPVILRMSASRLNVELLKDMRRQFIESAAKLDENTREGVADIQCIYDSVQLDDRFHTELVGALGNQYANNLMKSFVDYLTIIRSTVTAADAIRFNTSNNEHITIIDAILDGNIDAACQKLSEHIEVSYQEAVNNFMYSSL